MPLSSPSPSPASCDAPSSPTPRSDQNVPKRVEGLEGHRVTQVSGGWRHSMAVDSDGGLWAWGWNKVSGIHPYAFWYRVRPSDKSCWVDPVLKMDSSNNNTLSLNCICVNCFHSSDSLVWATARTGVVPPLYRFRVPRQYHGRRTRIRWSPAGAIPWPSPGRGACTPGGGGIPGSSGSEAWRTCESSMHLNLHAIASPIIALFTMFSSS